jgi:hypothetical protein
VAQATRERRAHSRRRALRTQGAEVKQKHSAPQQSFLRSSLASRFSHSYYPGTSSHKPVSVPPLESSVSAAAERHE